MSYSAPRARIVKVKDFRCVTKIELNYINTLTASTGNVLLSRKIGSEHLYNSALL